MKMELSNNRKLFIISAYATNAIKIKQKFLDELHEIFTELKLHKPKNYYILMGDLNASYINYGDRTNNDRGRHLKKWETDNEFKYKLNIKTTDDYTFNNAPTYLDLTLIDDITKNTNENTRQ